MVEKTYKWNFQDFQDLIDETDNKVFTIFVFCKAEYNECDYEIERGFDLESNSWYLKVTVTL